MDLYILTSTNDRSAAAVTSASDLTALEGPDDFAQLVLGSTEPLTTTFLTGANAYESWTADPTYTVTASLGFMTATGLLVFAENTLSTATAHGKSGNLVLSTVALCDAMFNALLSWRRSVGMILQITVTDPSGNRRVFAQLIVEVNGRVSTFTPTATMLASTTYLTAAEIAAIYQTRAEGYNAQANSSGNSTATPASAVFFHTEIVTFSGSARTSVVILSTIGRTAGDRIALRLNLPATAAIVAEVRNATATGTLLTSITSDGSGDDLAADYYFDGTAWNAFRTSYPA